MAKFTVTNVEQNDDDGTVNITGKSEDGKTVTFYNAYPMECYREGDPILYSRVTIDIPIEHRKVL